MLDRHTPPGPDDAVSSAVVRVLPRLTRAIAAELHRLPAAGDLSLAQFRALCCLSERPYRPGELAKALEVGRPALSSIVDALVHRGLVERSPELPTDRRGVLLSLTPAGRALHRTLQAHTRAGVGALLASATPAEWRALARGLDALERGLDAAGREAHPTLTEVR